jgi:hypothetical protein
MWEIAEHRSVYIKQRVDHAGHAVHTISSTTLTHLSKQIAERGLEPAERKTYSNGVRKVSYRDPDGQRDRLWRCADRGLSLRRAREAAAQTWFNPSKRRSHEPRLRRFAARSTGPAKRPTHSLAGPARL